MKPVKTGWRIYPPIVILKYWVFQGTLYMNWVERLHRWSLELLVFLCVLIIAMQHLATGISVMVAFITAHTLSAILNGHMFAMFTHDLFWFGLYTDKTSFLGYMEKMKIRADRKSPDYICGAVFFISGIEQETFMDTVRDVYNFLRGKGI